MESRTAARAGDPSVRRTLARRSPERFESFIGLVPIVSGGNVPVPTSSENPSLRSHGTHCDALLESPLLQIENDDLTGGSDEEAVTRSKEAMTVAHRHFDRVLTEGNDRAVGASEDHQTGGGVPQPCWMGRLSTRMLVSS